MYNLSSLVQHEFDCTIAWTTLVRPKMQLKRLIERIEDSMRPRRQPGASTFGVFGRADNIRVYSLYQQVQSLILSHTAGVNRSVSPVIMASQRSGQPMTAAQRALAIAQQTAHRAKVEDHPTFDEAARELATHFPLEALSLL